MRIFSNFLTKIAHHEAPGRPVTLNRAPRVGRAGVVPKGNR